jgi:PPOX class probable F420-dependent enzyme
MLDMENKRHAHIAERVNTNVIGWLITVRPDGRPHAVAVWFLWDGESILVFSKPNQQKVRNIAENPQVALALDDTQEGEDPIVIEGTAELVDDPSVSAAVPAYAEKYGELMKGIGLYPPERMAETYSQAIRITPVKVY